MFYFPAWSWDAFEREQADKKLLKQAPCAAALSLDSSLALPAPALKPATADFVLNGSTLISSKHQPSN